LSPHHYWRRYLELIKDLSRVKSSGQQLSVALPPDIPQSILAATASLVDMVHIMPSGQADPVTALQKLTAIAKVVQLENFSLIVRPKNFSDEYMMEQFIDQLSATTGIVNFSLDDIKHYQNICAGITE
jgi:hypothetical protein